MPKAEFVSKGINCNCGQYIDISDLIRDLEVDAISMNCATGEETYKCTQCEREHTVSLDVEMEVYVNCSSIITTNPKTEHRDKNRKSIPSSFFEELIVGDKVPNLHDGQYSVEQLDMIFYVENGEVTNIFSLKYDSNQLNLFEES